MTVLSTVVNTTYTGNAVTIDFPVGFRYLDRDHLVVTRVIIASGASYAVNPGEYTLTGDGRLITGTINYLYLSSPLPSTMQLVIARKVPFTQELSIKNQGGFLPEVLEDQLDLITMQTQQSNELVNSLGLVDVAAAVTATATNAATASAAAASVLAVTSGATQRATVVTGTVNAIQLTFSPINTALLTGETVKWRSSGVNTVTNPTVSKDGGATNKTIKKNTNAALALNDLGVAATEMEAVYNGVDWILQNPATENISTSGTPMSLIATVSGPLIIAQGRPTLITNTPVMITDTGTTAGTGGATRVYYTPRDGALISIWNGTSWGTYWPAEIFFDLSDTAKQPAATVASSGYYLFVWNDGGIIRLIHSPAWTNLTTVGAGAALTKIAGVDVNAVAITNGPAAGQGTCVGWFMTSAANTVLWVANPAAAAGGGNCVLGIGSRYNRVPVSATSKDITTNSYTSATIRAANVSNSNRVTFFLGTDDNVMSAKTQVRMYGVNSANTNTGLGLDSTTAYATQRAILIQTGANGNETLGVSVYDGRVSLGSHFFQALEGGGGSGISNINLNDGVTFQTTLTGMM